MNKDSLIIGIGGSGTNIINDLSRRNLVDSEFLVIDTDIQSLSQSIVNEKILIGERGVGLGYSYEELKLDEDFNKIKPNLIKKILEYKQVIVITGLGGFTGSAVVLYVLKTLKEHDIQPLTICIAPFAFEGKPKNKISSICLEKIYELKQEICILKNDNILLLVDQEAPINESFGVCNEHIAKVINTFISNRDYLKNLLEKSVLFADLPVNKNSNSIKLSNFKTEQNYNKSFFGRIKDIFAEGFMEAEQPQVIKDAEQLAQKIIEDARIEANRLLNESELLKAIQKEAEKIKQEVIAECEDIKRKTYEECEEMKRKALEEANSIRTRAYEGYAEFLKNIKL